MKKYLFTFTIIFLLFYSIQAFNKIKNNLKYPYPRGKIDNCREKDKWTLKKDLCAPYNYLDIINFDNTNFIPRICFVQAHFKKKSSFNHSIFSDTAYFRKSEFFDRGEFIYSTFKSRAQFDSVIFHNTADFGGSIFKGQAYFRSAEFKEGVFRFCDFQNQTEYRATKFEEVTNFEYANFNKSPNFDGASFGRIVNFEYTTFNESVDLRLTNFNKVDTIYLECLKFPNGKLYINWDDFKANNTWKIQINPPSKYSKAMSVLMYVSAKNHEDIIDIDHKRIERIYHLLRDNFVAQNDYNSADQVMQELRWRESEIKDDFRLYLYGIFFKWGYDAKNYLLMILIIYLVISPLCWRKHFYNKNDFLVTDFVKEHNLVEGNSKICRSFNKF